MAVTDAGGLISEQDAHAIAVAAYVYFYPLVTMDLTRKQLINVARAEGMHGPANMFVNIPAFPTADMKAVVRPNFDTLYSSAWLDLTKEPMVVSKPDTADAFICCRCSTCGPMCSPRLARARPETKPGTLL